MSDTFIKLTPDANAAVAVSPLRPRGRPREKTLYLGVPLLAGLDREELRAILCHELAHCAYRHHRFGVLTIQGSRKLHNLAEGLDSAMTVRTGMDIYDVLMWWNARVLIKLFRGYGALYDRITRSARHRQEYEADRVAAGHVGPDVMRRALLRAHETAAAWEALCRAPVPRMSQGQLEELYGALTLARSWPAGQRSRRLAEEPTFSHPALVNRLAALGAAAREDDPASTGVPSLRLLFSTGEGTRARGPKLPHPDNAGRRPITSGTSRLSRREWAPSLSLWSKFTGTLLALSAACYIAERWPR